MGERSPRPRVLVPTARGWYRHLSHTIALDLEDAMGDVAQVDLLALPATAMDKRVRPERTRVVLDEPYDVLFFVAMAPSWMRALSGLRGLGALARKVVVYAFDAWGYQTRSLVRWRHIWRHVDHLFVSYPEVVDEYASRLQGTVSYLPQATNPKRFNPDARERPIDFLSVGRRLPDAHDRLLALARERDLLYVFGEHASPISADLDDSRYLAGALCRASNVQVSWPVEVTSPDRARGHSPVTTRWFEAAACASPVMGRRPLSPTFSELFPYEQFVVDADPSAGGFETTALAALELGDRAARVELAEHVRREHSWQRRCETMLDAAL